MAKPNTPESEQVLRESMEVCGGDFSKIELTVELVSVYHAALPDGEIHSRDAFKAFLGEFRTALPDFQVTIEDVLVINELGRGGHRW